MKSSFSTETFLFVNDIIASVIAEVLLVFTQVIRRHLISFIKVLSKERKFEDHSYKWKFDIVLFSHIDYGQCFK